MSDVVVPEFTIQHSVHVVERWSDQSPVVKPDVVVPTATMEQPTYVVEE
jgi:hypothetical protein